MFSITEGSNNSFNFTQKPLHLPTSHTSDFCQPVKGCKPLTTLSQELDLIRCNNRSSYIESELEKIKVQFGITRSDHSFHSLTNLTPNTVNFKSDPLKVQTKVTCERSKALSGIGTIACSFDVSERFVQKAGVRTILVIDYLNEDIKSLLQPALKNLIEGFKDHDQFGIMLTSRLLSFQNMTADNKTSFLNFINLNDSWFRDWLDVECFYNSVHVAFHLARVAMKLDDLDQVNMATQVIFFSSLPEEHIFNNHALSTFAERHRACGLDTNRLTVKTIALGRGAEKLRAISANFQGEHFSCNDSNLMEAFLAPPRKTIPLFKPTFFSIQPSQDVKIVSFLKKYSTPEKIPFICNGQTITIPFEFKGKGEVSIYCEGINTLSGQKEFFILDHTVEEPRMGDEVLYPNISYRLNDLFKKQFAVRQIDPDFFEPKEMVVKARGMRASFKHQAQMIYEKGKEGISTWTLKEKDAKRRFAIEGEFDGIGNVYLSCKGVYAVPGRVSQNIEIEAVVSVGNDQYLFYKNLLDDLAKSKTVKELQEKAKIGLSKLHSINYAWMAKLSQIYYDIEKRGEGIEVYEECLTKIKMARTAYEQVLALDECQSKLGEEATKILAPVKDLFKEKDYIEFQRKLSYIERNRATMETPSKNEDPRLNCIGVLGAFNYCLREVAAGKYPWMKLFFQQALDCVDAIFGKDLPKLGNKVVTNIVTSTDPLTLTKDLTYSMGTVELHQEDGMKHMREVELRAPYDERAFELVKYVKALNFKDIGQVIRENPFIIHEQDCIKHKAALISVTDNMIKMIQQKIQQKIQEILAQLPEEMAGLSEEIAHLANETCNEKTEKVRALAVEMDKIGCFFAGTRKEAALYLEGDEHLYSAVIVALKDISGMPTRICHLVNAYMKWGVMHPGKENSFFLSHLAYDDNRSFVVHEKVFLSKEGLFIEKNPNSPFKEDLYKDVESLLEERSFGRLKSFSPIKLRPDFVVPGTWHQGKKFKVCSRNGSAEFPFTELPLDEDVSWYRKEGFLGLDFQVKTVNGAFSFWQAIPLRLSVQEAEIAIANNLHSGTRYFRPDEYRRGIYKGITKITKQFPTFPSLRFKAQ